MITTKSYARLFRVRTYSYSFLEIFYDLAFRREASAIFTKMKRFDAKSNLRHGYKTQSSDVPAVWSCSGSCQLPLQVLPD